MSCNCRNSFAMFNPFRNENTEQKTVERPKVKIIKKKKEPVEEKQEAEEKENEQVL